MSVLAANLKYRHRSLKTIRVAEHGKHIQWMGPALYSVSFGLQRSVVSYWSYTYIRVFLLSLSFEIKKYNSVISLSTMSLF